MIPHEITESSARAPKTNFEMRLDRVTSVTMLVVDPSGRGPPCACTSRASGRLPSVRKRPSETVAVRRWDSANAELYHGVKRLSKLCYDWSSRAFSHASLSSDPASRRDRLGR